MPIYNIQGPTGQTYKIEGPAGATDEQLIATLQQHLAEQPAPKKGVLAAGAKGLESLISSGRTAAGAVFGSPEEAAKAGLARQRQMGEEYAEPTSLERVKQAYAEKGLFAAGKEALGQVPGAIAEQLPQLGAMAGGARLGATAGSLFGPAGTVIGGLAGAAVPSLMQQFGGDVERQAAEQEKAGQPISIDRGAALAAAPLQTALDVAGSFIPFGGKLISKVTGIPTGALFGKTAAQAEKLANERLLTTLAKGTATGVVSEIPTEIAQQMLERAQAGLSLSSPDAMKEYGETAYAVGLLGPLGAVGRISEKSGARSEIEDAKKAEQDRAAAEAKVQADKVAAEQAAYKATPEYLLQLDQQHTDALAAFNETKKAVGKKPGKDADDDAKDAYKERLAAAKEAQDAYKAIREEHKPLRSAIAQAKEQVRVAGMSPHEYYFEREGWNEAPKAEGEPDYRTILDAQTHAIPEAPAPTARLEQDVSTALAALANNNLIQPMSDTDLRNGAVEILMRNPARAQAVVENDLALPGFSDKESKTIRSALRLQLKAAPKATMAAEKEAIQRMGAEGRGKVELEKTAGLFGDIAEQEKQYQEAASEERTEQLAGDLGGALSRAGKEKAPGVAVEPGLQKQNYATQADELKQTHEAALQDLQDVADDIHKGRHIGGAEGTTVGVASSLPALKAKVEAHKRAYIANVLKEAAARRAATPDTQAISTDRAYKAAKEMSDILDKLAALKPVIDVDAQQKELRQLAAQQPPVSTKKGFSIEALTQAQSEATTQAELDVISELLKQQKTVSHYPEKAAAVVAKHARYAAKKHADAVGKLTTQLEAIRQRLISETPKKQLVKYEGQSAYREAKKTEEASGETAKTLEGKLRRKRDYVDGLIDRALNTRDMSEELRSAFATTKDTIEDGKGSMELLDAAEEAASGMLRGQKQQDKQAEYVARINKEAQTLSKLQEEVGGAQAEMFGTEDLGAIRKSAAMFQRFLNSAAVAKLRKTLSDIKKAVAEGPTKGAPKGQLRRTEQAKALKQKLADKEVNLLQSMRDLTKQLRTQRVEATYGPLIQRFEKEAADFDAKAATLREALPETGRADPELDGLFEAVADIEAKISETRATITKLRERAREEAAELGDTALLAAADERMVKERAEVKAMQEQLSKIDVRTYDQRQQAAEAAKKRADLAIAEQQLAALKAAETRKSNEDKSKIFGTRIARSELTTRITAIKERIDATNTKIEELTDERASKKGRAASGVTKKIRNVTKTELLPLEKELARLEQKRSGTVTAVGEEETGATPAAESKEGLNWTSTKPVKPALAEVAEPVEEKTPKAERVSAKENIADIKSISGLMAVQGTKTDIFPKAKRQADLRVGSKANMKAASDMLEALESEKEGPVYRAAQPTGRGMDKAEVERLVAEHTKDWKRGPKIVITEAPREAGNATGSLSRDGKVMSIFYDKVFDEADVKATVFHEGLGHFGLRDMFKKKLDGVLESMYRTNEDIRKAANAWLKDNPEGYIEAGENRIARAVEEVLAIHSEAGIKDASLWSRIKAVVKAFARRMGLSDLAYTNEELDAIVAQAHQRVMGSGELGGALISETPVVYRAKTKYANDDDLSKLAGTIMAQPKSFAEKAGKHYALEAEMQTVDMRAAVRKALEAGAKALGDPKLFVQAMFSVTKADQKMSVVQSALATGPMRVFTDAKGFKGVESNNEGGAKEIFEAMSEIPDSYGDEAAKVGITSTYLIARRAMNKGLSKLDIGALGVTEEQLASAMRVVESDPALKDALEKTRKLYNTYNKGLIQGLVDTGTITKAQAASFLKDEDYVPFYRVRENGMAELVFGNEKTITIGDIRHQPYLAALKGGETKILPLNESLQRNTLLLTDKMLTNMAQRNVAYALQAYGAPQNLMKINKGKAPAGNDVFSFTQEPKEGDKNDTGERWVRVETNDTVLDGIPAEMIIKSLEGAHLTIPAFLNWGAAAGDLLRSGVTRTPLYLMRQLFRDPMAAAFTSGLDYGPMKAIYKANKAFLDLSRGQSETGAKLIAKGLIQSGIFTGDPDDMAKFSLQLASGKSQSAVDRLFAMLDRAAMNADAATRTLVYDNAIKNGLSEVEADLAVMESMNFHKRGLSPTVQYASRMIPFFNAQIQGLNVLYKAARGQMPFNEQLKIKKKFINSAVMLMGMGMVYAMAMDDDDYYKNAKPKDRYSNFFVPLPGVAEPLKLPIPYEAGWFFSMAVAAVDAMKGSVDTEQQFAALKDMVINAVPGGSSMGVPQIVKPLAEVWTNKSFYSNNPLESTRLQRLDPAERYNNNTTELAKMFSKNIGGVLSPIQLEHLVSGYMGQLPIAAMSAANGLFTTDQSVEMPEGRASELPVIGSAFQRKYGGEDTDVAYRRANEALRAQATLKEMQSTGRREDAKEYKEAHQAEIRAASAAGDFEQVMGEYRKREAHIRGMDIPAAEKRARLDKLEAQRDQQSARFIARFKRIEEATDRTRPQ